MKVLVTGGTGFVGGEILRHLHAAGHSMRLLVRDTSSSTAREAAASYNAELCAGNILDPVSLDRFLVSGEVVIHLVGIISEVAANTFENVHSKGTANVVHAAKKAGIERFIQMSALGTRHNAKSRYHQTKWQAEETVRESGIPFVIFRPSIIYGPHDAFANMFAQMAKLSPFLPVIGPGEGTFQPIIVDAVAKAFVEAVTSDRVVNQTIDLVGPEVFTMNEVLDQIASVLHRRRMKLHLPLPLARAMASVLQIVFPKLLRKAPPLNRDQIMMLQERTIGDGSLSRELLGINPPLFRDGLRYLTVNAC